MLWFSRVLLNVMYLMVETVRTEAEDDKLEWKMARETFKVELGETPSTCPETGGGCLFTLEQHKLNFASVYHRRINR